MNAEAKKKGSVGTLGTLLFIIIFFIVLIAVGTWAVTYYQESTQQPYIDRGCEPKTWGYMGSVSMWSCPSGTEDPSIANANPSYSDKDQTFIDRGCIPAKVEQSNNDISYWSCTTP